MIARIAFYTLAATLTVTFAVVVGYLGLFVLLMAALLWLSDVVL